MMMAAAAMGGMMLQMAMGKIALLAGKALLIGKVSKELLSITQYRMMEEVIQPLGKAGSGCKKKRKCM